MKRGNLFIESKYPPPQKDANGADKFDAEFVRAAKESIEKYGEVLRRLA